MTARRGSPRVEPLFLAGPAGPIFATYYAARRTIGRGLSLVYVPPFAEEMNCSRRMAALQARRLADIGIGALLIDLYGTGESGGGFADARWRTWLGDIAAAAIWLKSRTSDRIGLWGLRLGALLALQAMAAQPDAFHRALLWQPVADGKALLTQFLRLRLAASLAETGEQEKTSTMRQRLAAGELLEIAGYELAPELAQAIDAAKLSDIVIPRGARIDWIELTQSPDQSLSLGGRKIVESWRQAGASVTIDVVIGEPFWSIQETALVPQLFEATERLLRQ